MSSSLPQTATNSQSLNGIISLSDGVITIEDGTITGLDEIDLTDLQVSGTATIENLVVNNQIDMTLGQIKNVSAPTDNGDATNKQYVDTNFLNKTTTTTQNVASKLTFNNTSTDILNNPVIKFENAINTSSNGMVLQFKKNLINQPNLQIGGLVWLDQAVSGAVRRVCEMIVSNDSNSLPLFDIKFSSGLFNPLTIRNTQTILRNDDFDFINKTTTHTLLKYQNASDKWTCLKPLDMNTTNKIINIAEPTNNQDVASKFYVDSHSNNSNYLLRDGSLPMTGNLLIGSNNITNCNDITSTGNQFFGTNSTNNLDVKSSAFFEENVLIETNKHLAFNSGDLSSANGMIMNYDSSVAFLDVRGSEFRIRTASAGVPNTIRFKVNDTNTSVINNFFVNGNTTLGDNVANDITTFNSIANFPSGSELKFDSGSNLLLQTGATTTFASGSNTAFDSSANLQFKSNSNSSYLAGADLEYYNVQSFRTGSYIDGARVRLIKSGNSSFQLYNTNRENGVLCNNTSTISITMPTKDAYWNNRSYYIKIQTATVNLVQNTGTSIDNDTNTIGMSSHYRGYHLHFDSEYQFNGNIWRLTQI